MDLIERAFDLGRVDRLAVDAIRRVQRHLVLVGADLIAYDGYVHRTARTDLALQILVPEEADAVFSARPFRNGSDSEEAFGVGGIFGVGLWQDDDGVVAPALFVADSLISGRPTSSLRRTLLGTDPLPLPFRLPDEAYQMLVIGLDPPRPEAIGMGDSVEESVYGHRGVLGCRVNLRATAGRAAGDGITTAGHVATTVGAVASVNGGRIGEVVDTHFIPSPGPKGSNKDHADIAVIALDEGVGEGLTPAVAGVTQASTGDKLLLHTRVGQIPGLVRAVTPSFILSPQRGCWGQIIMTDRHYTASGDSGAPVFADDGTDRLVGHVVGGGSTYTLIQDIDYQLSSFPPTVTLKMP